jgi:hypothetical protein
VAMVAALGQVIATNAGESDGSINSKAVDRG